MFFFNFFWCCLSFCFCFCNFKFAVFNFFWFCFICFWSCWNFCWVWLIFWCLCFNLLMLVCRFLICFFLVCNLIFWWFSFWVWKVREVFYCLIFFYCILDFFWKWEKFCRIFINWCLVFWICSICLLLFKFIRINVLGENFLVLLVGIIFLLGIVN